MIASEESLWDCRGAFRLKLGKAGSYEKLDCKGICCKSCRGNVKPIAQRKDFKNVLFVKNLPS